MKANDSMFSPRLRRPPDDPKAKLCTQTLHTNIAQFRSYRISFGSIVLLKSDVHSISRASCIESRPSPYRLLFSGLLSPPLDSQGGGVGQDGKPDVPSHKVFPFAGGRRPNWGGDFGVLATGGFPPHLVHPPHVCRLQRQSHKSSLLLRDDRAFDSVQSSNIGNRG